MRRRYRPLPLNNMTPSQFLLAYDVRMSRMMRNANRMAAAAFAKRYGVRLPVVRALAARFWEIYCTPERQDEAAAVASRLARILNRA
jgi:hypothetical protein